jgi:hypothetical protein
MTILSSLRSSKSRRTSFGSLIIYFPATFWMASWGLVVFGILQSSPASEMISFIEKGHCQHVRFHATPWSIDGDGLVGEGIGNRLALEKSWTGDFKLWITLSMAKQKESAAGIRINESFFGFEGKKSQEVFLKGPLFRDKKSPGKSKDFFASGTMIHFKVLGSQNQTRFFINDQLVATGNTIPHVHRFELVPYRSKMTVKSLVLQGDVQDLPTSKPRRYHLPTIDLAKETHRQILVDREKGQYLGHPTTVLLDDRKTMLCVYPKGHGRGAIVMKRSKDAGLTWSPRLPTPESWKTSQEVPTIHQLSDRKGKKRLVLFSGLYPIRMSISEDQGETWSELQPIGDFGGIVTMGCVESIGPGRYMALFHDDGRFIRQGGTGQRKFYVYKTTTDDGGLHWSKPVIIAEHPTAHLCEPGLIRSPNGKQITVLLRENSRRHNSFMIQSDDEGKTWTRPVELPASLTGDRHTGKYTRDGRLFISFRDTTHETPTPGDWVAWVGTYDDIIQGREGQYRIRLMDNRKSKDCAYPGVEILQDDTIVTTTYGHWTEGEAPYIMSVRLKLDEIDRKAAAMKKDD